MYDDEKPRLRVVHDAGRESLSDLMTLARSLPSLKDAPGLQPFNPTELDAWAVGADATPVGQLAARLVIDEYTDGHTGGFDYPAFDLVRALNTWDAEHLAALSGWFKRRVAERELHLSW